MDTKALKLSPALTAAHPSNAWVLALAQTRLPSYAMIVFCCVLALFVLLGNPENTAAQSRYSACKVVWDNPNDADLAGVRLYVGTQPGGPYDMVVADVPAQPGTQGEAICALPADGTYYMVARAYDTAQPSNESGNSNEVALVWDKTAPGTITITISALIQVQVSTQ